MPGVLLTCILLSAGADAQTNNVAVTGYIKGSTEGQKVYLKYADTTRALIDSAVIHDSHFVVHWRTSSPRFLSLVFQVPVISGKGMQNKVLQLFAEAQSVVVTADYDSLKREYDTYSGKLVLQAKVTGSPANDWYQAFYRQVAAYNAARYAFFDEYIDYLNPKDGKRGPAEAGMLLTGKMDSIDALKKAYLFDYIRQQPASELLAFIAKEAAGAGTTSVAEIDGLVAKFASVKDNGPLLDDFRKGAALARKTAVGAGLYSFTLTDLAGKPQQLSQYIGKGKYVMLEFWASWCHPCRADIPHLKEAHKRYHDLGFDIVSVSLDSEKDKWLKAVGEEQLEGRWPQLADPDAFNGDLAKTYRINAIPACLLFDPNGKLVTRNFRGSWMDSRLIALFGNRFSAGEANASE